jgi:RNA polymerase sigma-70 factor (ECF subfamily)
VNAAEQRHRFEALVMPHLDAAFNLARWLIGSSGGAGEAEDVVQEAMLRALTFFDGFHGDQPRPWLLAIVRNTWFTTWRRRHDAAESSLPDDGAQDGDALPGWQDWHDAGPEQRLSRADDVRLVRSALETLPVAFREVIVLRELEDLSYREIAQVAEIPLGTVMSRLARGRNLLAQAVLTLSRPPNASQAADSLQPSHQSHADRQGSPGTSQRDTHFTAQDPPRMPGEKDHGLP